jgi:hypothetical protein
MVHGTRRRVGHGPWPGAPWPGAVSPDLIEQARRGEIDDAAFTSCIATSLPYAWQMITGLIGELHASGADLADNQVPPPDEAARGQLLRVMASDAMRGAIERHYGVRLAFQNCHRAAVFRPGAQAAYQEFIPARSQILNQRPELVDC